MVYAGNNAPALTNQPVTNNTPGDATPPGLSVAEVNGSSLSLTYNESLDTSSVPAGGDFTIKVNGEFQPTPTNVNITGNTVAITLAEAVMAGESVTISYTPGTGPIRDMSGNNAPALTDYPVVNNTQTISASELDPTITTSLYDSTSFLYTGIDPVQTGVSPDTIEERRAAVLRGKVTDRNGTPLAGAKITIADNPQYGSTLTRSDGYFDMAVNGGGILTVDYQKDGYLPVQRRINVPWQDFAILPDVVMINYDSQVTEIDLADSAPLQVARGAPVTDEDGTRQATLLIPRGTTAEMVMPDGSSQHLTNLSVRATEYTVGENGPDAMPGELPPNVGYTYAVEYSVDQAVDAGASDVQFNQPVIHYVENFIGFPVGGIVPTAYYDREEKKWIPSENGRVIKVIGTDNGRAILDIDGSGSAASPEALAELGVTDVELQRLAELYQPGQSLWRVKITHFTPWDCNWPVGTPAGAISPSISASIFPKCVNGACIGTNSGTGIEYQNQVIREARGVYGTSFSLNYNSYRVDGFKPYIEIPTVPEIFLAIHRR
ncbi:MAG: SwmB domain-containing protein [Bacillota bacterium]